MMSIICYDLQTHQISTQLGDFEVRVGVFGVILVFWLSEIQGKQERGHCAEHRREYSLSALSIGQTISP